MKTKKMVLQESEEAAKFVTGISGWVDRHGHFWGYEKGSEDMARWAGCTHKKCECGNIMEKSWSKCKTCRDKRDSEKYQAMPRKEWSGEGALYSASLDEYFFSWDEVTDFAADESYKVNQMQLIICEPVYLRQITPDCWEDDLPEDGELPEDVEHAIDDINHVIAQAGPIAWEPGKFACEIVEEG